MTLRHPLSCGQHTVVLWNTEEEKQDDDIHTTTVLARTPRGSAALPEERGPASISLVREHGLGQRPAPSLLPHGWREAPTRPAAWLPGERHLLAGRGESAGAGFRSRADRCQGTWSLRSAGPAFTPHLLTEDAAGVIQALELDRPHLLGFSMGADTAVRLATTHPGLVRTVIVSGANDQAPHPQHIVNSPGY